ncbi:MAG TPA: YetF domain-containing protein [Azospirillum sp.]
MFFDTWSGLGRVLVVGTLAYVALVFLLRMSDKRTLTKLNAFDLVVTVALGSTLATVLLSKSVALAEGILALGLLIFLQYAITWLSVRSPRFQALIKAEPSLLVHRGRFLDGALRAQRITREEILAAVRAGGAADIHDVAAVVLETDGSISVIADSGDGSRSRALEAVSGWTAEQP